MKKYLCNLILIMICVMALTGCFTKDKAKIYREEKEESKSESEINTSDSDSSGEIETTEKQKGSGYVYIQLGGAVKSPGVYKVLEGTRVFEAVEIAGGTTQEADIDSVNLARPVTDEMKIYVPTNEEVADSNGDYFWEYNNETFENEEEAVTDDGLININEATKEKLMELPGIGQAKAEAIINYREEKGGFNDVTEIMNISGIKEAAFEKIKNLIKV